MAEHFGVQTPAVRVRNLSAAGLLFFCLGASAAGTEGGVVPCVEVQRVRLEIKALWRCAAMLEPHRAYLARVDRQLADVTLEWVGPDSKSLLKVDSPTHRAGPEILLVRPRVHGTHVLVLDVVESGSSSVELTLHVSALDDTPANKALLGRLGTLTSTAVVADARSNDDAQQRISKLAASLTNVRGIADRDLEAEAKFRIAALDYWNLGDWEKAAAAALDAMQAFDRLPDPIMSAQAAMIRAASLIELAHLPRQAGARAAPKSSDKPFDEAERLLGAAADEFHRAGMKYDEGHALNNLGLALFYRGQHVEAKVRYLAAARLFRESNEPKSEVLPLQNIAALQYERGDYAAAAAGFEQLRLRLDGSDGNSDYVAILNNLGTAQYVLGNTDEALKALTEALRLSEKSGDVPAQARALHALGRTYLILGDEDRASIFLEQALELRRSPASHDRRGLLISLVRNGDLYRERGAVTRALQLHLQAVDQSASAEEKGRVLLAVGLDQLATGSVNAAIETYERALELDLPADWPVRVSISGAYGNALMLSGDAKGRALVAQAAYAHEAAGDDDLAALDYVNLATDDRRNLRYSAALINVTKALVLYESMRIRGLNPDLRAAYVARRAAAFELQVDIYMSLSERAKNVTERTRLQATALLAGESLRNHALEDFRQFARVRRPSGDGSESDTLLELDSQLAAKRHRLATVLDLQHPSAELIASLRREIARIRTAIDVAQGGERQATVGTETTSSALSIARLQQSIARDTVVLTWLLGEERSWAWCVTREEVSAFELSSRSTVEQAAKVLYSAWSVPSSDANSRDTEVKASRLILGEAAPCLRRKGNVVVVADGLLRAVPVGALWLTDSSGHTNQRIAETHVVSYRPTLSRWRDERETSGPQDEQPRMLLVGDPVILNDADRVGGSPDSFGAKPGSSSQTLPPLPGSRREVAAIVRLAKGWRTDVLLGEQATKDAVLAEPLDAFRVLHFATHARLDVHDPQLSAIVLSGSALSLREVMALNVNSNLIVLSACEGSLGKEYRGQLSFGLSEALLLAGSRHVLGSLWQINDAATERYMQIFYDQYLRRGLPATAAAQAATRTLMRDPVFGHPFYWAAFVMLGA